MLVGGKKGFLGKIFRFKVISDDLAADRENQILIRINQIFIILLGIDYFRLPSSPFIITIVYFICLQLGREI
jgi:hypothetical protein